MTKYVTLESYNKLPESHRIRPQIHAAYNALLKSKGKYKGFVYVSYGDIEDNKWHIEVFMLRDLDNYPTGIITRDKYLSDMKHQFILWNEYRYRKHQGKEYPRYAKRAKTILYEELLKHKVFTLKY